MLLKDSLDREFYIGDRLCRLELVFALLTKALLTLSVEDQRECFEQLVTDGKATKRTLADGRTEYSLSPPLVTVAAHVVMFDDGVDAMQRVTND
jgi:hypothetical protein